MNSEVAPQSNMLITWLCYIYLLRSYVFVVTRQLVDAFRAREPGGCWWRLGCQVRRQAGRQQQQQLAYVDMVMTSKALSRRGLIEFWLLRWEEENEEQMGNWREGDGSDNTPHTQFSNVTIGIIIIFLIKHYQYYGRCYYYWLSDNPSSNIRVT